MVVNGMSEHARDRENANSALLVQIRPEDYGEHALDGIAYQEALEKKAFVLGGGAYRAPAQRVEDFLKHRASTAMGSVQPSYALGVTPCDLHEVLPAYVTSAMEEAITAMDHKLKGFAMGDAVLTGVETRSSSPFAWNEGKRICRVYPFPDCIPAEKERDMPVESFQRQLTVSDVQSRLLQCFIIQKKLLVIKFVDISMKEVFS